VEIRRATYVEFACRPAMGGPAVWIDEGRYIPGVGIRPLYVRAWRTAPWVRVRAPRPTRWPVVYQLPRRRGWAERIAARREEFLENLESEG
jgi:hypothetical protein